MVTAAKRLLRYLSCHKRAGISFGINRAKCLDEANQKKMDLFLTEMAVTDALLWALKRSHSEWGGLEIPDEMASSRDAIQSETSALLCVPTPPMLRFPCRIDRVATCFWFLRPRVLQLSLEVEAWLPQTGLLQFFLGAHGGAALGRPHPQ